MAQLGAEEPAAAAPAEAHAGEVLTLRLEIRNPLGLHARPAARFVQTAAAFEADIEVTNLTSSRGPASGRSLNGIATLGIRQGNEILVTARGPQAEQALAALSDLAGRDFDEQAEPPRPMAPPPPAAGGEHTLAGLSGAPGIASGPARHFKAP
ncbi:MAG TPA: HPr family phosphocarrier protein, partial [Gaiellaceae bacterium]